jgi:membrane associated rhomboid family serine protease
MITTIIIIVTAIVSVIAFQSTDTFRKMVFNAYMIKSENQWYRFFSHAFIHADWMHLIFNMLVLYFFGRYVELVFQAHFQEKGILYFLLLYIGGFLFASLPSYKKHNENIYFNAVGASGAVSAVLFAGVVLNPLNNICLWFVLCFPGIIWAIIYLVYSYYMSKKGGDNINHDAHLWGAVYGVLFTIVIRPEFALEFLYKILIPFS